MELSEWFLAGLRAYDTSLSAVFDDQEDTIHLYYQKSGQRSLAYSVKREFGELYNELQRKILKELPLHDVWKRFGSGKAYDDWLHEEESLNREAAQKKIDHDRMERMKEDKWKIRAALENAKAGRFTEESALPIEIPTVTVLTDIPKEGEGNL